MAAYYYGINKGDSPWAAVAQGTQPTKDVILIVDNALTEVEVKKALDNLLALIQRGPWPPS